MLKKLARLYRSQKGITGLETAIILIAFVVVASVFAYTVLSAGLFSTQKSQEAITAGLEETQSTLELRGSVVGYSGTETAEPHNSIGIAKVEFTVTTQGDRGMDLTPPYTLVGGVPTASSLDYVTQIAYNDVNATMPDVPWTIDWTGSHTDDYILEKNEKAVVTVWLHLPNGSYYDDGNTALGYLGTNRLDEYHEFTLEVKPSAGATLNIQRTTPAYLDTVIDLH